MSRFLGISTNKIDRTINTFHRLPLLLLSTMMICSLPAHAQYDFQVIAPPGSEFTQTFGINDAGKVAGVAFVGGTEFGFVYDINKGTFTEIDAGFSPLEINNGGVMVGDLDGICAVRDKMGNITTFFPPSWDTDSFCQARGVNSRGDVSGFNIDHVDQDGVWTGFVYDPMSGTFEEFLPSPQTIAHAINAQGQNVGSVSLDADVAYPGSASGRYGYRRQTDGSVKYFEISQSFPGFTRGRGISESGLVAGWYLDPDTFENKSFVTKLSSGNEFESITLTDDQILYRKPCDPNLPPAPEPGYELFTDVAASQVRNDGVVVGNCFDSYFNSQTGDFVQYVNGFIATPTQ